MARKTLLYVNSTNKWNGLKLPGRNSRIKIAALAVMVINAR